MNNRIISLMIVCTLFIFSCRATRTATQGVTEENSTTEITVRTESVSIVDQMERTMHDFYVIIGSFRSIENARQYNIELMRKGFVPVILESENGLFRISVGGYDNENMARSRIAGIRANHTEHSDVWLLVRRQ